MSPLSPSAQGSHPGNNFDAIRIVAATMVLVSHHYALTGQMEPSFFGIHSLGGLAVTIFFVISGYLVTASWQRDPNVWRFGLRRFLRIWPALTAVIVLTAYGLGAWVTELPLGQYLTHGATANYLQGLWMKIHFVLPGVFEHNPYPSGVNGSLWTIPIEVRCYLFLGLAGVVGLLRFRVVFLTGVAIALGWFLLRSNADLTGSVHYGRELSAFFLSGAALQALEPQWRRRPALWAAVLCLLAGAAWVADWRHTALLLALPFAVIYGGTCATPFLRRAGRWGDPSYGIYLFAFPVQQTIILYAWPEAGFAGTLLLAMVCTTALAYASWHLLEKQALKFKPSRQQRTWRATLSCGLQRIRNVLLSPWAWPVIAGFVGLRHIARRLDAPVLPDPEYTYLPAARAFLEQGWSFLLTPQSYQVTPLAYLWPALWGAEPVLIRLANMGLWIGSVFFLWRTCCLLGGPLAGASAMVLLLLSSELLRYFPSEMTEPLFLFALFGWMHALARIVVAREYKAPVVLQGAIMLALTLLTRPVLQLVAPAGLLACMAWLAYRAAFPRDGSDASPVPRQVEALAWSVAGALVLPLALVLKNGLIFGLWGLGTGSGIGLYLGTHPLFQGAEPGFLGFGFDVNTLVALTAQSGNPLSQAGDRATSLAAFWQLQSMAPTEAVQFFTRKLWWWLAHHPAQIDTAGRTLRNIRLLELFLIAAAASYLLLHRRSAVQPGSRLLLLRRSPALWFAALLALLLGAMLVQLLPILHNSRYSSVLLDPWLIPLAALSVAVLVGTLHVRIEHSRNSWSFALATRDHRGVGSTLGWLLTAVALSFTASFLSLRWERNAIDPERMGEVRTIVQLAGNVETAAHGMQPAGEHAWVVTQSPAFLHVAVDALVVKQIGEANLFNAIWETQLALESKGGQCRRVSFSFQTFAGRILQPAYRLPLRPQVKADGVMRPLAVPANHELRPREPGSLRIEIHCPAGTRLEWGGTRVLESRHPWDAAAHIQPRDPA